MEDFDRLKAQANAIEAKQQQKLKDTIAQEVKDCVTNYLCNYTHAKGDVSDWIPMHEIIDEVDRQIENTLLKMGCEKEEKRREKLRNILVQIALDKQHKAEAKLEIAVEALRKCTDPRLLACGINRIAENALKETSS